MTARWLTIACALGCIVACGGDGPAVELADAAAARGGAADAPPADAPPFSCIPPIGGELQDVRDVSAAPYLVHHPEVDDPLVSTIMFLPGGSGSLESAIRAWNVFLANDPEVSRYRVLIPYTEGNQLIDEGQRAFRTLDAVLYCYGGDRERVHVAGYSNGGRMAFWFMLVRPDRFVTLLGAPGLFPPSDPVGWGAALAGRRVFNGVGELDDEWRPSVMATHEALLAGGVDSIYVEFPGAGHRPSDNFDQRILFDFWGQQ